MPFVKGHKKTGGRQKGTPNKLSLNVKEILDSLEFDPIKELIKIVEAVQFDRPDVCAKICMSLAEFVHPKRKAIEHSGEIKNPYMDKSLKELEGLVKERLKK